MKLTEYIEQLQELAQKHPNATVIYSKDDEGNGYSPVHYSPSAGEFKGREFNNDASKKVNAVCIN
jgi:hypothetical protein